MAVPDPASITDAYAAIKVLSKNKKRIFIKKRGKKLPNSGVLVWVLFHLMSR